MNDFSNAACVSTLCVRYVYRSSTGQSSDSRGGLWSGELSKNLPGFGYSEKQVTVAVDSAGGTAGSSKGDVKPVKEVPLWLAHSTVVDTLEYTDRLPQHLQVSCTFISLLHCNNCKHLVA